MIKNIECCTSQSALVKYNASEWKTCPEFSITHQTKYELCLEKTYGAPKAVFSTADMETSHRVSLCCNPRKTDTAPQERSLPARASGEMDVSPHG